MCSSEFVESLKVLRLLLLLGRRAIEAKISSSKRRLCFSYCVNICTRKIKIANNKICKIKHHVISQLNGNFHLPQ